jgi:hypothetical protein
VLDGLISFAWTDPQTGSPKTTCHPGIAALARRVGKSERVVRLSLRNLEHFGYIRVIPDGSVRTHRLYELAWRAEGNNFRPAVHPEGTLSPRGRESRRALTRRSARTQSGRQNYVGVGRQNSAAELHESSEPDELPSRAGANGNNVEGLPLAPTARARKTSRERIEEFIGTIADRGGVGVSRKVTRAAALLAKSNKDAHSVPHYCKALWRVTRGEAAGADVLAAFDATQERIADGSVESPGAYFFSTLETLTLETVARRAVEQEASSTPQEGLKAKDHPPIRQAVAAARQLFGSKDVDAVVAMIEGNAAGIMRALGGRVDCYIAALQRASRTETQIQDLNAWCIRTASIFVAEGGPPVRIDPQPLRRAAPGDVLNPLALKADSCIDDILAAFGWFAKLGRQSPQEVIEAAVPKFCATFDLDPARSKYQTSRPDRKLRCDLGFRWVCRWLAGGELSWISLCDAMEGAKQESRSESGHYDSQQLGRSLLRRLVGPAPEPATSEAPKDGTPA